MLIFSLDLAASAFRYDRPKTASPQTTPDRSGEGAGVELNSVVRNCSEYSRKLLFAVGGK